MNGVVVATLHVVYTVIGVIVLVRASVVVLRVVSSLVRCLRFRPLLSRLVWVVVARQISR